MNKEFKIKCSVNKNNKHDKAKKIDKNAFFIEGGGTKGVYAIGILKYLYGDNEHINLKNVDIFGGTSVGSYLSTALSLGYQKDDVVQISNIIDISKLIDSKYMFLATAYRFLSNGYLYDDAGRQNIVYKILQYKMDIINEHLGLSGSEKLTGKNITFGHLKTLIEKYPTIYKHLLINTVDISKNDQIFMTTLNDEWVNIKLFDALLASSAIPFVFKPTVLYYYPDSKIYGYIETKESTINVFVDGGVSTNNPLDFFLLNDDEYSQYNLWLLKFTSHPQYVKIDGTMTLLKQLSEYLVSGKNDVKMALVEEQYHVNTINLHSTAGTLDMYTADEIQQIIDNIYNQCVSGTFSFDN